MKKAIATLIILLMSITFVTAAAVPAQRDITVTIDGAKMEFPDQKPYIENSRTLVPVICYRGPGSRSRMAANRTKGQNTKRQ